MFISLLLIAIISGIIIDKFGELRQRKQEYEQDLQTSCFICGTERKEFDRDPDTPSFSEHVKLRHNVWDYVYFIAYLQFQEGKQSQNMTAVEKYVLKMIRKGDNRWFPCYEPSQE